MKLVIEGCSGSGKTTAIRRLLRGVCRPVWGLWSEKLPPQEDGAAPVYLHSCRAPVSYGTENQIGACRNRRAQSFPEVFETLGAAALREIPAGSLVVLDEIGVMESEARQFQAELFRLLDGDYDVIAAIRDKHTPLLDAIRAHPQVRRVSAEAANTESFCKEAAAQLGSLWAQLDVRPGVTSVIGSGGKTTLLHVLAAELSAKGTVVLTTSTHIRPSQTLPCLVSPTEQALREALALHRAVCIGSRNAEGKLSAPELSFRTLASLADYVLVEADGSRRLPLKAHAAHEPVIPENSGNTVCVVGAGGLGQPISEVVHRPELFCRLGGAGFDDPAAPEAVARVLNAEALADLYYVNQCDLPGAAARAETLATLLHKPTVCGSLWRDHADALQRHEGG